MSRRRMFSTEVIDQAEFITLPVSARLLYFDLGMKADDDGVVHALAVIRTTGATEEDLRLLEARGFVRILKDTLLTWIVDWRENNMIRRDRYRPSKYHELVPTDADGQPGDDQAVDDGTTIRQPDDDQVIEDVSTTCQSDDGPMIEDASTTCQPGDNQAMDDRSTACQSNDIQLTEEELPICQPDGDPMADDPATQVRLGQVRIGQVRTGQDRTGKAKRGKARGVTGAKRCAFAPPAPDEVSAYALEMGYEGFNAATFVDYYTTTGWMVGRNPMKDWRAAVRTWHTRDARDKPKAQSPKVYRDFDPMTDW